MARGPHVGLFRFTVWFSTTNDRGIAFYWWTIYLHANLIRRCRRNARAHVERVSFIRQVQIEFIKIKKNVTWKKLFSNVLTKIIEKKKKRSLLHDCLTLVTVRLHGQQVVRRTRIFICVSLRLQNCRLPNTKFDMKIKLWLNFRLVISKFWWSSQPSCTLFPSPITGPNKNPLGG